MRSRRWSSPFGLILVLAGPVVVEQERISPDEAVQLVLERLQVEPRPRMASPPETGANDFRISDMGATGDPDYDAGLPAVTYNSQRNQYLVAWRGDDNLGGLADDEMEVFVQRLWSVGLSIDGFESGNALQWD